MEWKEEYYSARLCNSKEEIDGFFHFSDRDAAGFSFYHDQISSGEIWPLAVLCSLGVPAQRRRAGLGTKAVEDFLMAARDKGARIAFLRVGWEGGLTEDGLKKLNSLLLWYEKRGWKRLQNPPATPGFIVPFMYHEISR